MEIENWYPLNKYQGYYEISESGKVRSLSKRNFHSQIKPRIDRGGYLSVRLSKHGQTKTHFVHRLLALQFISKPVHKNFVNHKNGIKSDNTLSNLEWVTHQENVIDAYKQGLNSFAKKLINQDTGEVYHSIKSASERLGINYSTCRKRLRRKNETFSLRYTG
jgi:DNA-binding protein Fis